jgi:diguanylate cyclase (GGDEF)-like protein
MKPLVERFRSAPPVLALLMIFTLMGCIGFIDYVTGVRLRLTVFYLIPITLTVLSLGGWAGAAMSVIGTVVWFLAEVGGSDTGMEDRYHYWNAVILLADLLIVNVLLAAMLRHLENERSLARTDELTRVANRRAFYEQTSSELDRSRRYGHPFTVAYIDLDDFKAINDRFGHGVGDKVLLEAVSALRKDLRNTDLLARLGGDEFAILLPESDAAQARPALDRMIDNLRSAMDRGHWPVTASIGAITFTRPPETNLDVIRLTDNLMYAVKTGGKNACRHEVF